MGLFKKKLPILGLDIGSTSLILSHGSIKKHTFYLENFWVQEIPTGIYSNHGILNFEKLSNEVNSLFDSVDFDFEVSLSLNGMGIISKNIIIPKIPKKEIPDQVKWEAEQVFSQDMSEIEVDYVLLGESENVPGAPTGTKGWSLLLIGVRKELLNKTELLIDKSNKDLVRVDIDAFSIGDFFTDLNVINASGINGIIEVGFTSTRIYVVRNKQVVFMREFAIAAEAFFQSISQTLGLSMEDSISLLASPKEVPQEVVASLQVQYNSWLHELQQCEDIYMSQNETDQLIDQWVVFGGGVKSPGFFEAIDQGKFKNKISIFNVDKNIKLKGKKVNEQFFELWKPRLISACAVCGKS